MPKAPVSARSARRRPEVPAAGPGRVTKPPETCQVPSPRPGLRHETARNVPGPLAAPRTASRNRPKRARSPRRAPGFVTKPPPTCQVPSPRPGLRHETAPNVPGPLAVPRAASRNRPKRARSPRRAPGSVTKPPQTCQVPSPRPGLRHETAPNVPGPLAAPRVSFRRIVGFGEDSLKGALPFARPSRKPTTRRN